jgi:diguanylate cyclase (GGDEF)-like protein
MLRALIVEDSSDDAALLIHELKRHYAITFERVETEDRLSAALDREPWDIVFADFSMPQFNGVAALKVVRERGFDVPFIFVSGTIGEDRAVEAMKAGAQDYIVKGSLKRLLPAVQRELRDAEVRRAHQQAESKIQYMAFYDALTDLPNRNMFYERLRDAIRTSARDGGSWALLLMDLDRFKDINETLGHARGDLLLQQVGARLQSILAEPAVIARLGGDEFGVLLPRQALQDVTLVAKTILKGFEAPFSVEALPIAVEASIGIALYPEHGTDADRLMQGADVALYAAKRSGGYVTYNPERDQRSPRRLAILGDLREAIERDRLTLHYQPKIDCTSGEVSGAESLLRWHHAVYGAVRPDEFIGPAEQTGLIKPLTQWVLNAALRQWKVWEGAGVRLAISVNLSARNLHDPDLVKYITDCVERHGVAASLLTLEITEGALMEDPGHAKKILAQLRDAGIRLSIDDFGTGYSSLSYLKEFPVHEVKIDKSFIIDLGWDATAKAIVHSIVDLGRRLGLHVVAEGVEDEAVWAWLRRVGCDTAQGYYMGKPMSADEFVRWVKESEWGLTGGRRNPKNRAA